MAHTPPPPGRDDVRIVADARGRGRHRTAASTAADIVVRSLLTGVGTGLVMIAGSGAGVVSVTVVGILALAAALLSWDP